MVRSGVTRLTFAILLHVLCCGYAALRGGAPERIVACSLLIAFAASIAIIKLVNPVGASPLMLLIDLTLLACLYAVSVSSPRFWPIWATGLHILGAAAGLVRVVDPSMQIAGYQTMIRMPSYLILVTLTIGTVFHRLRLRRSGTDRSWRPSLRIRAR